MKFDRRFLSLVVLVLALSFAAPAVAHAQDFARGKFTLTSETHWGPAVLPAGDYVVSFDSATSPTITTIRGADGNPAAMIFPLSRTEMPISSGSLLQLERRGKDTYVSSFYLKELGVEFQYFVPKATEADLAKTTTKESPALTASTR
jgi:hypothetical protein